MTYTSEDQIERMVERRTDAIDRAYMSGQLTREEYRFRMRDLNASAEACYRALAQSAREARFQRNEIERMQHQR